ncbi:CBO0543 family protein [Bacillaceae bacterium C204]|uniref:CBO0543 family protein n=1 Tax=Neobacillus sp. 204 TaxID=3383351 RepID=UPI0039785571
MTVIYEKSFDWNEWVVIITLLLLNLLILITPKIFSMIEGTAHYLFGITVVTFFDHTTSVRPWDLYDVNDSSKYQLMDFIYYVMNGPFSFFFMYLYSKLRIKGYQMILYILIWSSFGLLAEWIGVKIGLFHYNKGYKMYWSFPIYMLIQTIQIIYYHKIQKARK